MNALITAITQTKETIPRMKLLTLSKKVRNATRMDSIIGTGKRIIFSSNLIKWLPLLFWYQKSPFYLFHIKLNFVYLSLFSIRSNPLSFNLSKDRNCVLASFLSSTILSFCSTPFSIRMAL